jgi:hypothetical protein
MEPFDTDDFTENLHSDLSAPALKDKAKELRRQQYLRAKKTLAEQRKKEKIAKKTADKEAKAIKQKEKDQKLWEAITFGSQLRPPKGEEP